MSNGHTYLVLPVRTAGVVIGQLRVVLVSIRAEGIVVFIDLAAVMYGPDGDENCRVFGDEHSLVLVIWHANKHWQEHFASVLPQKATELPSQTATYTGFHLMPSLTI